VASQTFFASKIPLNSRVDLATYRTYQKFQRVADMILISGVALCGGAFKAWDEKRDNGERFPHANRLSDLIFWISLRDHTFFA